MTGGGKGGERWRESTHVVASVATYTLFVKRASSPIMKDECDGVG